MRKCVEEGAAQLLALDPVFWSKVGGGGVGVGVGAGRGVKDAGGPPSRTWGRGGGTASGALGRWTEGSHHQQLMLPLPPQELLLWLGGDADGASGRSGGGGGSSRNPGGPLYSLLCRCLEEGPWRQHCQRLLQLLPQQDLLPFATDLLGHGGSGGGSGGGGSGSCAATATGQSVATVEARAAPPPSQPGGALLVFRGVCWDSLDELLLAAALGCCLPLLLRQLQEEEAADERQAVERLVLHVLGLEQQQQEEGVAGHWQLRRHLRQRQQQLRRQGDAQGANAAGRALHEVLLLHLFASAFLTQELSNGSTEDAVRLQELLCSSGFECLLLADGGVGGVGDGDGRKKKRRWRDSAGGANGSKRKQHKKKKKRRRRRHGHSEESSGGDDSGSGSDGEGMGGGGSGRPASQLWGAAPGEAAGDGNDDGDDGKHARRWRLRGGGAAVSSLESLDAVISTTAAAHAAWLFGGDGGGDDGGG